MKGKILLGLTAILMLTGAAVPVKADDVWKFDAQRFVLKEYTGTETDVVVPDTMDEGVPVKRLGTQLLAGSETLTSVVVPDSVTILDVGALSYDNNLSEITLSSNLINIGWNAISSNDALTELTIPASVCIIDSYAVSGCYALKKIVFEGACPLIGPEAFVMLSDDVVIYVPDDQIEEYKKVFEENNKNLNIQPSGKPAVLYSAEDYLDTENLKKGDTLLLPESSDTMDLLKTESIKGVYNVNKGYAVFKQVQILSESDEYYIIAEGNSYSLSNYDHIALNGDSVRDNQIVSQ